MMANGTLAITVISASFSHYASFDSEPNDLFAVLRCNKEQRCTQIAQDQGRLPVWNETLEFYLQQEDISEELVVQVFSVINDSEELLGTAKIPIQSMVVRDEATLSALIHQHKGETGKLKVAWKWQPYAQKPLKAAGPGKVLEVYEYSVSEAHDVPQKPLKAAGPGKVLEVYEYPASEAHDVPQKPLKASSSEGPGKAPEVYEYSVSEAPAKNDFSKLDAVSDALRKISLEKQASGVRIAASAPPYVEPETNYVKSQASELPYPSKALDSSTPSYPPIQKEDAQQAPWSSSKHTSSTTYPSIQESYPSYQSPTSELAAHGNERPYPPLLSSTTLPTYPPASNDSYPPYDYGASAVYPPPAYTQPYRPPPQDVPSIYPPPPYPPHSTQDQGNSYLVQSYPPPLGGAYPPSYPPQQADVTYPIPYPPQAYPTSYPAPQGYPASYPPQGYPPPYPPSERGIESVSYDRGLDKDKEKGKGKEHKEKEKKDKDKKDKDKKDKDKKDKDKKDKDKKDKDKHKTHDSSGPYGQSPYYGALPQGYGAAPPQVYGSGPQGYPPPPVQGLYPPPPQGYPPMAQPQGVYPPAPQPYPHASHGYAPPLPQGYPPSLQGYPPPPQAYHSDPYNAGSSYPPTGYPPHDQPHYATQHGSSSYGGKH